MISLRSITFLMNNSQLSCSTSHDDTSISVSSKEKNVDSFSVIVKEWRTNLFEKDIINKTKRIIGGFLVFLTSPKELYNKHALTLSLCGSQPTFLLLFLNGCISTGFFF